MELETSGQRMPDHIADAWAEVYMDVSDKIDAESNPPTPENPMPDNWPLAAERMKDELEAEAANPPAPEHEPTGDSTWNQTAQRLARESNVQAAQE